MKKYSIQKSPFIVPTTDGKLIEEHFGHATISSELSIAHMIAPPKWSEPYQTPEFEEYTYIIKGKKQWNIKNLLHSYKVRLISTMKHIWQIL